MIALHDYRYLGEDFRERERIKRKKQRWVNRLQTMPVLERQASKLSVPTPTLDTCYNLIAGINRHLQ